MLIRGKVASTSSYSTQPGGHTASARVRSSAGAGTRAGAGSVPTAGSRAGLLLSSCLSSSNSASFSLSSFSRVSFSVLKAASISSLPAPFAAALSDPLGRPPSSCRSEGGGFGDLRRLWSLEHATRWLDTQGPACLPERAEPPGVASGGAGAAAGHCQRGASPHCDPPASPLSPAAAPSRAPS